MTQRPAALSSRRLLLETPGRVVAQSLRGPSLNPDTSFGGKLPSSSLRFIEDLAKGGSEP